MTKTATTTFDLYNPTEQHEMLRRMVRDFVKKKTVLVKRGKKYIARVR